MPAVSVITPAFNAARYIGQTIASVRAQTFDDWELVVVDDGSTDGTVEIVEDYRRRDGRIRLLRQANAGPSAARNRAMHAARGAFFALLDSDDAWEPDYLASQLAVFDEHPETALVTGVARYRGGPLAGRPMRPHTPGYPALSLRDILADDAAVFIMSVFRRQVFDTIGGMDERQWRSEDYDFWLRTAAAGFVVRRNSRPLGHYRVRDDSLSHSTVEMLRGLLQTYDKARALCAEGTPERAVLDAQVNRFEQELLLARAKLALEAGSADEAATLLQTLYRRGGRAFVGLAAWLARHAPRLAALAYRLRGLRSSALRRGPRPGVEARAA